MVQRSPVKAVLVEPPPPPEPRRPNEYARLFAKKPLSVLIAQGTHRSHFRRALGPWSLTLLGLGAIIGTGIFVLTGTAARDHAGPAIVLSFLVAGFVAALAAFAYAELASMIPVAGSAYTYAYAGIGELVAWIIAWDLILEYAVGAMTVAQGWSGYVSGLLAQVGFPIDPQWTAGPLEGGVINLPAVLVVLAVTALLVYGIQESANVTNALVLLKVAIIVFIVLLGLTLIHPPNYVPFIPPRTGDAYGWQGIVTAAGLVFFAYIGFDALSTTAEETKNPKRDLPIGILLSLSMATLLYILASFVLTGMERYDQISYNEPFAPPFEHAGYAWAAALIRIGAAAGITSVLIVLLMSQPRIFFAMARDGLLPGFIAKVHPRFRTPYVATIITGVIVAIVGGLLPISILASVTNIGTLFAFGLVAASVVILRRTDPDAPRGYRVPGPFWLLPGLGALGALVLILFLPVLTLLVFVFWFGVGLIVYAAYGYRKSHLRGVAAGPSAQS
jgi:APA family basic amino acid/polyamine antiporter